MPNTTYKSRSFTVGLRSMQRELDIEWLTPTTYQRRKRMCSGQGEPGLLGLRPSRQFKIYRTEFPAIFRFNGRLYQENYDIDNDDFAFVQIDVAEAQRWLRAKEDV
jgi:hypothetical protein